MKYSVLGINYEFQVYGVCLVLDKNNLNPRTDVPVSVFDLRTFSLYDHSKRKKAYYHVLPGTIYNISKQLRSVLVHRLLILIVVNCSCLSSSNIVVHRLVVHWPSKLLSILLNIPGTLVYGIVSKTTRPVHRNLCQILQPHIAAHDRVWPQGYGSKGHLHLCNCRPGRKHRQRLQVSRPRHGQVPRTPSQQRNDVGVGPGRRS